jgi:hypothetical protein
MCDKYREFYGERDRETVSDRERDREIERTEHMTLDREREKSNKVIYDQPAHRHVRVLWDIENVSVPKRLTGLQTVERLRHYLSTQSLCGPGIDCRITAFFHPNRSHISKQVIEDLDRGGIELVWVSSKREDADRKIVYRLTQDMQVLAHTLSTVNAVANNGANAATNAVKVGNTSPVFVLISSDQDFRNHLQLLQNQGFEVIVIQDSQSERVKQTLSMHVNRCVDWRTTVLELEEEGDNKEKVREKESEGDRNGEIKGDREGKESETENSKTGGIQQILKGTNKGKDKRHKGKAKDREQTEEAGEEREMGGEKERESESQQLVIGWFPATCVRWKGVYGFLSLSLSGTHAFKEKVAQSEPSWLDDKQWGEMLKELVNDDSQESEELRLYAHYKALQLSPHRTVLKKDEEVKALIVICKKGLRAIQVMNIDIELDSDVNLNSK